MICCPRVPAQELFCSAVYEDMHKCHTEAISTEVDFVLNEVRGCLRDIHRWVKPKPMRKQFMTVLDGVMVKADPYGVALVMGSWNYPINLLLTPMCGALAAGNCVILKPSELSPFVAKLIGELVPQYLDSDCVKVSVVYNRAIVGRWAEFRGGPHPFGQKSG
jgi:aldehyde dehydrogenase (NAD+)